MTSQQRMLIFVPALLIAGWLAVFGDKTPEGDVISAPARTTPAPQTPQAVSPREAEQGAAGGVSRLLGREGMRAEAGREPLSNLFAGQPLPNQPPPGAQAAPEVPAAPQFPYVFVGREYSRRGWTAFFELNGEAHVVRPGSKLQDFKVSAIEAGRIVVTHVPTGTEQIIPIEGDK